MAITADLSAMVSIWLDDIDENSPWIGALATVGVIGALAAIVYLLDWKSASKRGTAFAVALLLIGGGTASWGIYSILDETAERGGTPSAEPGHSEEGTPADSPTVTTATTTPTRTTKQNTPIDTPKPPGTDQQSSAQFKRLSGKNFSMGTSDGYDFDLGRKGFASAGADMIVDCCGISATSATQLTVSNQPGSEPDGCRTDAPYSDRVQFEELPTDRPICVITDQDRLAVVTVRGPASQGQLPLAYTLWAVQ
ncbi:MAG: hypothetical protein ABW215_04955 [Kibdelosporangium sp.]